jgi:hypothetical protein
MAFQPLTMQRAIRDDATLTAPEKGLLLVAVLRTDNGTRRVRASLQRLAEDAGLGYRTARRVFQPANGKVMRYFETVERGPRFVNLTFCSSDRVQDAAEDATVADSDVTPARAEAASVPGKAVGAAASTGQDGLPSAPLHATPSAPSYSKEWIAANAPSFDDDAAAVETPSPSRVGDLRESPPGPRAAGPRRPLPADRPPRGYLSRQL